MHKRQFRCALRTADVSVGESVRVIRELQGMSQNDLAKQTGILQNALRHISFGFDRDYFRRLNSVAPGQLKTPAATYGEQLTGQPAIGVQVVPRV
jgi:transcriptional regulator with XRE-family HTH domain